MRQATDEVIPTANTKHSLDIQIVRATKKDIPTMWVWGETHWELWNSKTCKWYSRASLRRWLVDPRHDVLLVAKAGNKLIGMCVTHIILDFAYCTGLFIEKKYRGNGVATKLVGQMMAELRKKGVKEITLSANTKNNCAISLFESFGFKKGYPTIPLSVRL
ncbi:MAG: GNAT family N-acetyltransferase [Candidatus Gottesmanbacteria bacterium]|nr:GNAT family N-acetyltransferase [Candidatus Gottesmanbacteria bacterium]